jgi:hypothetical protein
MQPTCVRWGKACALLRVLFVRESGSKGVRE